MDLEATLRPLEPSKKKGMSRPNNSRSEARKPLLFESRPLFRAEDYKERMWSRLWNIYTAEAAQSWNDILSTSLRLNKALNGHAITVEVGFGEGEIKGLFEKHGNLDFDKWKIKIMGELRFTF